MFGYARSVSAAISAQAVPHGDAAAIDYDAAEFLPDGKRELGDLRMRKGDRVVMRTFLDVPDRRLRSMASVAHSPTDARGVASTLRLRNEDDSGRPPRLSVARSNA